MRRWILYVIIPLVVLIGAMVITVLIKGRNALPDVSAVIADSLLTNLPADVKRAEKEFEKAQNALLKLEPAVPYIVINTHSNKLCLRTEDSILVEGTCSTGSGEELIDSATGRHWIFNTPRGVFKVNSKVKEPWWRKPDWAFIEEDEDIPKTEAERLDPEMLGEYALGFGKGYFIHGTIYERLLGISVTHGCVRLGSEDLKVIYDKVKIGTPVYIF